MKAHINRPRTTEDIVFLVGDQAFERHEGGFVTKRVPVIEFDGINVDRLSEFAHAQRGRR